MATTALISLARNAFITFSFSRAFHPPMQQTNLKGRERALHILKFFCHRLHVLIRRLDTRIDDKCLSSAGNFLADEFKNLRQLVRARTKVLIAPRPPGSSSITDTSEIAVKRQAERARNRRRCHHEQVRVIPFAHQRLALRYAELMLLVNDDQAELGQIKTTGE